MANSPSNPQRPTAQGQQLWAACQAGALRAGWSLSRALGISVRLVVHDATELPAWQMRDRGPELLLEGPGLVVLMPLAQQAAVFAVGTSMPGMPAWLARPDGLERGRLAALAQELATSLLPRHFAARDCAAGSVRQLGAALARAGCGVDTICVEMSLAQSRGSTAGALLIWPLDRPEAVFEPEPLTATPASQQCFAARDAGELQQVKLSVSVVLAKKREPVSRIVQLAPGDVLRFDKSHRTPLELRVDGQRVAAGQCVEVGRRLGIVITSS